MLETVLGKSIERGYFPGSPFDALASVPSNWLARAELQWLPGTSMRDGLSLTSDWMKGVLARLAR